jgi:hypothetical protein
VAEFDEIALSRSVELRLGDDGGMFVDLYIGEVVSDTWAMSTESRPSRAIAAQLVAEAFLGTNERVQPLCDLLLRAKGWIEVGSLKGVPWQVRREWVEEVERALAGEPSTADEEEVPSAEPVELPDWVAPEGQRCYKQWIPMGVVNADIDVCLLEINHKDRQCRTLRYGRRDTSNALFQGQLTREG